MTPPGSPRGKPKRGAARPRAAAKKPKPQQRKQPPRATSQPRAVVPDTSVLVDGRITRMIQEGELKGVRVLIPKAVVAELEHQANEGRESGFNGLDEIVKIQELKPAGRIDVDFVGERPSPEAIDLAEAGEIDAMIRQVAVENSARLYTSDRVQAHVARAIGLDVEYIRPITRHEEDFRPELADLEIMKYFDADTMSVHLKYDVAPLAKKGTPGGLRLVKIADEPLDLRTLKRMRRELIEAARRDANSFVEIERHGATVVQLGPMRISIAQPPFSDGLEITAVRPVRKLGLDEYALPPELRQRLQQHQRGVFVSGPPGSGKSTFVTAVAEWLDQQGTIVKTMESPRDLQVPDTITQYAPLEGKMELTSDILLLVRPDFVVYDEVRRTSDFETFADMRLAGVGLIGVTHANRAIDAVQRLIGRVELGMIPQIVDTVVHIQGGKIEQVLEMTFTVKVPQGMMEADLARPVIEVRDFATQRVEYELYTYGEQIVVMPVAAAGGREGGKASPRDRLAAAQLQHELRRYVDGRFDVEMSGDNNAILYAQEHEIPRLIGKGGKSVQALEAEVGIKLDIRPLSERSRGAPGGGGGGRSFRPQRQEKVRLKWGPQDAGFEDEDEEDEADVKEVVADEGAHAAQRRYAELTPELRKSKKNVVLVLRKELAGQRVNVTANGEDLFVATISSKGEVRVSRRSHEGQTLMDALARGDVVRVQI